MISDYQVMPILKNSFIGVPTAQDATPYEVLRVLDGDGTVTLTFTFDDASTKIIAPPIGVSDWAIAGNCASVTSTLNIIMS